MQNRATYNRVERLFFILQRLYHHDGATARDLAEESGASVRSIYRDIRELQDNGFIITSHGKDGYKLTHQVVPTSSQLNEDEFMAIALYPLLTQGTAINKHPFYQAYQKALNKVNALLQSNSELGKISTQLGHRIRIHDHAMEDNQRHIMHAIVESITDNVTIACTYHAMHRDDMTERKLDPYYLVPREGYLYLVAYCHWREGVRIFRLNRFKRIALTNERFRIREDFDIDQYLSKRWSIQAGEKETTFRVRFASSVARYILEADYYVDALIEEREDGSILFEVTVKSAEEFLRWIKRFGSQAEVLAPQEYREQLQAEYRELVNMYER